MRCALLDLPRHVNYALNTGFYNLEHGAYLPPSLCWSYPLLSSPRLAHPCLPAGLFFQWVLCTSIWSVGAIVQLAIGSVPFQAISAIGGASWATGNVATVVIVESIGLAQGML